MLLNTFLPLVFISSLYSKGNCNTEISENFIFRLVNSNATGNIKAVKENQFHVTGETNISIECLAHFPIKIVFSGVMPHEIKYTKMEWMKPEGRYRVSIGFENIPEATGPYTCVSIDDGSMNEELKSTIYIFADNGADVFLLHWSSKNSTDNTVTVPRIEENVTIPCLTFRPYVQPTLLGVIKNNTFAEPPPVKMYHYDPSKGFLVDVTNYIRYDAYECSINNSTKLTFKMPDVNCTFTPPGYVNKYNEIDLKHKINISIKCESLNPFQIMQNSLSLASSKEERIFYYKYTAEAELDLGRISSQNEISCTSNSKLLGKWSFVSNAEFPTEVYFNYPKNKVYCKDSSGIYGISLLLIDCHNLANCDLVQRFGPWKDSNSKRPYPISSRGVTADAFSKKELGLGENENVVSISPNTTRRTIKMGIIFCEFKSKESKKSILISRQYSVDLNDKPVVDKAYNESDVLRIPLLNGKRSVYLGESINIICEASIFIFAEGLQLNVVLRNGSNHQNTNSLPRSAVESSNMNKITLNETIIIWSENITEVECRALKWKEREWMSISQLIEVKDGEIPSISVDGQTSNMEFHNNSDPKNITCRATGIPLPTIRWVRLNREGYPLMNTFVIIEDSTSEIVISKLTFPNVVHEIYYIYNCIATNALGETKKTFVLEMNKSDTGIQPWIVYTTVAVVLLLSVAVVAVLCKILKTKQMQIDISEAEIVCFLNGNENLANKYQELHEVAQYLPYKQHYEIHPSKIEIKNDLLGSGQCGIVTKGLLQKSGKQIPVAVKTVKSGCDISHLRTLLSEIKIMMYIGNHPHIIEMLGAITKDLRNGKLFVAIEFCSNGNLQNYLRNGRSVFQDQIFNDEINTNPMKIARSSRRFFGIEDAITTAIEKRRAKYFGIPSEIKTTSLITWCYQVASGMEYLTSKKIIHGDLATRNLLLTDALSVKITDFGLARHLYDYTNYVTKQKSEPLPWRWLSIEAIKDSKFSTESDVWAYGVTLWEIFSLGEMPYQGLSWGEEFVRRLAGGYRMGKPQYATDDIYNTMMECWNTVARDRPSFQDISKNFKELMERVDTWSE